jgi:spermidine synthase
MIISLNISVTDMLYVKINPATVDIGSSHVNITLPLVRVVLVTDDGGPYMMTCSGFDTISVDKQ